MKILYVMDPIEKINVMGDSTFVLMMESQNDLESYFAPYDLFSVNNLSYGKIKHCLVSWERPHLRLQKKIYVWLD